MSSVLFIDDELDTLSTLKKGVELFGHQALLAQSGSDGIELALSAQPDIIFVDMQLGGISGLEVVRLLRQDQRTAATPIYVLSAGPELDAQERAISSGANAYLLKPVRLQTLIYAIEADLTDEG